MGTAGSCRGCASGRQEQEAGRYRGNCGARSLDRRGRTEDAVQPASTSPKINGRSHLACGPPERSIADENTPARCCDSKARRPGDLDSVNLRIGTETFSGHLPGSPKVPGEMRSKQAVRRQDVPLNWRMNFSRAKGSDRAEQAGTAEMPKPTASEEARDWLGTWRLYGYFPILA
jgi:hypothetical protein